MAVQPENRSIPDLLKELRDETRVLFKQEIALASTEMSEKGKIYARNSASIAAGSLVLYAGVLVLLWAAVLGLYQLFQEFGMSVSVASWLSPLIIGVVVVIVGYAFLQKGISTIKDEPVMPQKTVASLKEDKEWAKSKLS